MTSAIVAIHHQSCYEGRTENKGKRREGLGVHDCKVASASTLQSDLPLLLHSCWSLTTLGNNDSSSQAGPMTRMVVRKRLCTSRERKQGPVVERKQGEDKGGNKTKHTDDAEARTEVKSRVIKDSTGNGEREGAKWREERRKRRKKKKKKKQEQ